MSPSDPPSSTRPPRRFSAIKPAVRRSAAASGVAAEAGPPVDPPPDPPAEVPAEVAAAPAEPAVAAPRTAPAAASSPPVRQKASDEARIAKVMARAGLCSRRDAEGWILDGRVAINGETIDSPARNVLPTDAITVDGYPIDKPEHTRLFLFHKTRGLVTTARDPEGRPTVFDALPPELPRLLTIGRLDINTEGLLLLTNDGGLARLLELPSTGWIRRYRVRANGSIDQGRLDALAKGITIDGVTYAGIAAKLDRVQGANLWLTMGLKEGKNREIKRVLEHLGLAVTRLIRVSFGPFQLGELGDNAVEEVRTRVLKDQLGSALAKQAGVDFDSDAARESLPAAPAPQAERPAGGRRPARADEEAPRRQTRRSATEDRRGRPVAVETISTARPERGAKRPRTLRQADRRTREDEAQASPGRARPGVARSAGTGRGAPAPRAEGGARTRERADAGARTKERSEQSRPWTGQKARTEGREGRPAFAGNRRPRDDGAAQRPEWQLRDDRPAGGGEAPRRGRAAAAGDAPMRTARAPEGRERPAGKGYAPRAGGRGTGDGGGGTGARGAGAGAEGRRGAPWGAGAKGGRPSSAGGDRPRGPGKGGGKGGGGKSGGGGGRSGGAGRPRG